MAWAIVGTQRSAILPRSFAPRIVFLPAAPPPRQHTHPMPQETASTDSLLFKRGLLLAGVGAAASCYVAFKRKHTKLFKATYAASWLTLGPAAILYASPDRSDLEAKLRASASKAANDVAPLTPLTDDAARRVAREAQLAALKAASGAK